MDEAELLFTQILDCSRPDLYLNKDFYLDKDKLSLVSCVLKRRIKGEPIQYILGKTEFMGLEFKVDRNVLIPRPETELLVETVIEIISSQKSEVRSQKILDLCTGSGCIGVCLAKFLPAVKITATDISKKAIEIAKINAFLNNVTSKIKFIQSDLLKSRELNEEKYDVIVTNPPYICRKDIKNLEPEIQYEPKIALDGGGDGLDFYRMIALESNNYLKEGAFLVAEMGLNQRGKIEKIFGKYAKFEIIEVIKDYNNIDRVIVAKRI